MGDIWAPYDLMSAAIFVRYSKRSNFSSGSVHQTFAANSRSPSLYDKARDTSQRTYHRLASSI